MFFWRRPLLLASVLVNVLLPLVVAGVSGNLGIPHNDGWAYSKIAERYATTGSIDLVGWNRAALLGQFIFLGPLARSLFVQQIITGVFGIMALVCLHEILCQVMPERKSGIAVVAFGIWPGFSLLTTSFMEDIPAISTSFLAILLAERAIVRNSSPLFVGSLICAIWSFTIREQGIATVVGIIVVTVGIAYVRRSFRMSFVMAASMTTFALLGVFSLWRRSLPNADAAQLAFTTRSFRYLAGAAAVVFFELALIVGPVILLSERIQHWKFRSWIAALMALCVGGIAWHIRGTAGFFLPNYFSRNGAYAVAWPSLPIFSSSVWGVVVVFAICMGCLVIGQIATMTRSHLSLVVSRTPVMVAFSALTFVGIVVALLSTQGLYDRYLISLLPIFYALTVHEHQINRSSAVRTTVAKSRRIHVLLLPGAFCLTFIFGVSMAVSLNAWARDAALWDVASEYVDKGYAASRIDAGLGWIGWSAPGPVVNRQAAASPWGRMFGLPQACITLTSEKVDDQGQLMEIRNYRTFLLTGQSSIFLYRLDDCV